MNDSNVRFFNTHRRELRQLKRRFFAYSFQGVEHGFQLGGPVAEITISDGALLVDGLAIPRPQFGANSISWSQESGGRVCSGKLFLDRNGFELHGVVSMGTGPQAVHTSLFASAVPPTTYRTQLTNSRQPAGSSPAAVPSNEWSGGLQLDLGYSYEPGDSLPTLKVSLGQQDFTPYVAVAVTSNDLLQVTLAADNDAPVICAADGSLYLGGSITFSTFGDSFTGSLSAICADQSGAGDYLWKGVATNNAVLALPQFHTAAMAVAAAAPAPSRLSLGDLIAQAPDDSVGETAHAMLVENMKWAMAQSTKEAAWLSDFFAQTTPALPKSRTSAIQQDLNWYQDNFAPAYLTWGLDHLTGPMAPSVTLDTAQEKKLRNYLEKGVGNSAAFTRQMQPLFDAAYATVKPRIQLYINDTASNWGQQLFDFVTSPTQLILIVNRIYQTHDMSAANHFAQMLMTLDPSAALAKEFQLRLVNHALLDASLSSVVLDYNEAMTWMPQAIDAFLTTNLPPSTLPPGAPLTEAQEAATDLDKWATTMGGTIAAASALATIVIQAKGSSLARQGELAADAFARTYPKWAKAANCLFFFAWVGGIFQVIVAFTGKQSLSARDILSGVNSCVDIANRAVGAVVDFFSNRKFTLPRSFQLKTAIAQDTELRTMGDAAGEMGGVPAEETPLLGAAVVVDGAFGAGGVARTPWTKFLKTADKVVPAIAVLTSAVAAALATWAFAEDVQSGKPISQQALDGISMAAGWVQTVCLAVGLFVMETVLAIAAAVLAIIGLIVAIIEIFWPAPAANQPVDNFMRNTGIPFVNGVQAMIVAV